MERFWSEMVKYRINKWNKGGSLLPFAMTLSKSNPQVAPCLERGALFGDENFSSRSLALTSH